MNLFTEKKHTLHESKDCCTKCGLTLRQFVDEQRECPGIGHFILFASDEYDGSPGLDAFRMRFSTLEEAAEGAEISSYEIIQLLDSKSGEAWNWNPRSKKWLPRVRLF